MNRKNQEEEMKKGNEELSGSDGYVHYIDCGVGFAGVIMLKLTTFYTLNMCSYYMLINVNETVRQIKTWKKKPVTLNANL